MKSCGFWMTSPGSPWAPRFIPREPRSWWWLTRRCLPIEEGLAYIITPFRSFAAFKSSDPQPHEALLALYGATEFHAAYYFTPGVSYKYGLPEFMQGTIAPALEDQRRLTQALFEEQRR